MQYKRPCWLLSRSQINMEFAIIYLIWHWYSAAIFIETQKEDKQSDEKKSK